MFSECCCPFRQDKGGMCGPGFMKRDLIDSRITLGIDDRNGNRSLSVTLFVMRSYVKPFQIRTDMMQQVFVANDMIHVSHFLFRRRRSLCWQHLSPVAHLRYLFDEIKLQCLIPFILFDLSPFSFNKFVIFLVYTLFCVPFQLMVWWPRLKL